jgi:uncharacterized protein YjbI with pentapeptide repeats
MNKAVIVALLFCVTSFTGCIGGDNSTDLEVLKEEEQIEPVGQNDLSNVSKDLETLQSKVDEFLNDFNSLKSSQEVMNSSLSNMIGDLETDLLILELDLKSISNDLDHLHDDMDEMGEIKKDQFLLQLEVSNMSNDLAELVNGLNQLTLMSLMDENERHVFMKMLMVQRIKEEGASNLNLTGADLSGQDLSGVDFSDADLSHANLDGARFVGNNFSGAKLDHSHANGAYFRLVNFEATSVSNSHWNAVEIVDSSIENSKFDNTEMHNCIIHHTSLIGSNFDRVKANDCYFYFVEGQESSWKGASLDHSTFEVSNFDESDFSKIVDGPSTKMVGVTYASVSFIEATFAFADMSHSTMKVSSNLPSGLLHVMKADGTFFKNCYDNNDDGDNNDCDSYGSYQDREDRTIDQEWIEDYDMWVYENSRYINCVDFMGADLNNTKLDNSKICVTQLPEGYNEYSDGMNGDYREYIHTPEPYPVNARFEETQFRRADMTNVHFGGSMLDWNSSPNGYSQGWFYNSTGGCLRIELSCINFSGAALTLADLSNSHFDYADLSGADFSGSSAAGVAWGHAMWHETNWTDSSEINGRGDPNEWDSDED